MLRRPAACDRECGKVGHVVLLRGESSKGVATTARSQPDAVLPHRIQWAISPVPPPARTRDCPPPSRRRARRAAPRCPPRARKRAGEGKGVSVRVSPVGGRNHKKKRH